MKITDVVEGYTVLPPIDKVKYQPRDGLEGPFRLRNGKVVYYDPQEGSYYDPDTDMYISYDDYKQMDENNIKEDDLNARVIKFVDWVLAQGDKYKNFTTKPEVYAAAKKAYKAYVKTKSESTDKRPAYVVRASDKQKKVKPSMGGSSPHPYQGKLVGATEAEVSNTDYEWTHGKKPKGTGSWFFVAHKGGINFGKDVEGEDYIQLHQMSYGDAKKAAVKWAKSKGHTSLFVAT